MARVASQPVGGTVAAAATSPSILAIWGHPSACRHASLAGVSRRCWQLAHAPLLLHAVDVLLPASAADISWFFAWLTRHAALHVAQLSITIGCVVPPPPIDDVWDDDGDAPYPDSVLTALHYGLQACSALSQLAELRMTVHQDFELQNADFAALPGSLRRFEVGYPEFDDRTRELWLGGLQHLTALQQASFRGRPVRLAAPPSSLPPSLTSLALHGIQSATGQTNAVPEQVDLKANVQREGQSMPAATA